MKRVPGRAYTLEEKRAILARFLEVWSQYNDIRFGQLLDNALSTSGKKIPLFSIEDDEVCKAMEEYLRAHPPSVKN